MGSNQIEVNKDLLEVKYQTDQKQSVSAPPFDLNNNNNKAKPQIKDFEIGQLIGAGNFAKVFKAYNSKNERVCALKVISKENIMAMKQVDHIISERQVLKFISDLNKTASAD